MLKADIYDVLTFQSTPSYEGEHDLQNVDPMKVIFQSTPSYEGELRPAAVNFGSRDFNPLPHTRENAVGSSGLSS